MSFFKRLFGGSDAGEASAKTEAEEQYDGFHIAATPAKEGGQYRLQGIISKTVDGQEKSHRLIRADLFSSKDECVAFTIRKAKQVIDEQGEKLFD